MLTGGGAVGYLLPCHAHSRRSRALRLRSGTQHACGLLLSPHFRAHNPTHRPAHWCTWPQLRAFARSTDGSYKQELNQSPLLFKESSIEPDMEEQLRRKDAIIHIRNAQVAALWDELHTRAPWRNAAGRGPPLAPFGAQLEGGGGAAGAGAGGNATRLLAFLGINTVRILVACGGETPLSGPARLASWHTHEGSGCEGYRGDNNRSLQQCGG